jgi:hypothetical protein
MVTLRCDGDFSKIAKGQIFLAFICEDCQRGSIGASQSYGARSLDCAECKSCGHIRSGYMCECSLGDWLSVTAIAHLKN